MNQNTDNNRIFAYRFDEKSLSQLQRPINQVHIALVTSRKRSVCLV